MKEITSKDLKAQIDERHWYLEIRGILSGRDYTPDLLVIEWDNDATDTETFKRYNI